MQFAISSAELCSGRRPIVVDLDDDESVELLLQRTSATEHSISLQSPRREELMRTPASPGSECKSSPLFTRLTPVENYQDDAFTDKERAVCAFLGTGEWLRDECLGDLGDQEAMSVVKALTTAEKHLAVAHCAQSMVAGPAIKLAFISNAFVWGGFLVFPLIALPFCTCSEGGGMARYPTWLMAVMVLTLAAPLFLEFQCIKYLLPAQVFIRHMYTKGPASKRPTFLGMPLSLRQYLLLNLSISFLGHLDLVTNSLFLAKAWKTHDPKCSPDAVSDIFDRVMREAHWPWNYLDGLPISIVVLFAWCVMMLQLAFGILHSVPWRYKQYNLKMNDRTKKEYKFFLTYETLANSITHHQEALYALAESGRMTSLKSMAWDCMKVGPFLAGSLEQEMQRTVRRFGLFTLFETVLFMQIQATSLGLARCLEKNHLVDHQLIMSLVLSVLSTGLTFAQTSVIVISQHNSIALADTEDKKADEKWAETHPEDTKHHTNYNIRAVTRNRHYALALFIGMALTFVACICWAVGKMVMIMTSCTCGWNVQWPPIDGCVNVDQVFTP